MKGEIDETFNELIERLKNEKNEIFKILDEIEYEKYIFRHKSEYQTHN